MPGDLVLVTGVSGFLGAHVVDRLVKDGYRVRGTVRAAKVAQNQKAFSVYGNAVEITAMDDLIKGVYPDAFKGVDAVIHVAAPLVGKEATAEAAIAVAVDGSINILTQAEKAGIKNFAYASSIITFSQGFANPADATLLKDDEWLPITKEYVFSQENPDGFLIYAAEKTEAERAVWKFVEEHPHVELTTVNPPFFYGPFAPGYTSPYEGTTFSSGSISTMGVPFFHNIIRPDAPVPPVYFVDVRDIARSLVAALKAPSRSKVGQKRILIGSETVQFQDIASLIARERPELASRVNKAASNAKRDVKPVIDNRRLKEVLGLEPVPWTTTILDAVDSLVKLENEWKARGVDILEGATLQPWSG